MKRSEALLLATDYAERMTGLGPVSVHRYFGGAGLRASGRQFAFVIKGVLYLRAAPADRPVFEAQGCAPFSYQGASGQVIVSAYFEAPPEILDDPDILSNWALRALRATTPKRTRSEEPRK